MEELVLYFSLKYKGDFKKIYEALMNKEKMDQQLYLKLKKKVHCKYTTIVSPDYPNKFKEIKCPPFVLYYYGDLSLLNESIVSVVGTRNTSKQGEKETRELIKELVKNNYHTVSGLAQGIDTIVHEETINQNGKSIAILGSGIDCCYPKCNQSLYEELKQNHLILTEYPFDTQPNEKQLMFRSRIISALCDSIIVCECRIRSNAIISVHYALEQGKEVFCLPVSITSPYQGTNELIKQGARLLNDIKDLKEEN